MRDTKKVKLENVQGEGVLLEATNTYSGANRKSRTVTLCIAQDGRISESVNIDNGRYYLWRDTYFLASVNVAVLGGGNKEVKLTLYRPLQLKRNEIEFSKVMGGVSLEFKNLVKSNVAKYIIQKWGL